MLMGDCVFFTSFRVGVISGVLFEELFGFDSLWILDMVIVDVDSF